MPIETLAQAIGKFAQTDGGHTTGIERLSLLRCSVRTEPLHCIYGLGLAVVAQGGKQVIHGEHVTQYGPGQSLVTTVDMPVVSHVTHADAARPLLAMMLTLDARALVQLREEPLLIAGVAPLIQQEIRVRVLLGPHGPFLRHLVASGSPGHQVAQAMAWLKQNFTRDVLIDELAARAHMSPSSFRLHFRDLAGMSPLQYQKQLRLQEARQLMLNQALDAGSTAARVGYESASQFSRDYSRLFGAPPQRDIKRMQRLPNGGVVGEPG